MLQAQGPGQQAIVLTAQCLQWGKGACRPCPARQTTRQTDRQTDRQTQIDRQTDTDRQTDRHIAASVLTVQCLQWGACRLCPDTETNRQLHRQTDRQTDRYIAASVLTVQCLQWKEGACRLCPANRRQPCCQSAASASHRCSARTCTSCCTAFGLRMC